MNTYWHVMTTAGRRKAGALVAVVLFFGAMMASTGALAAAGPPKQTVWTTHVDRTDVRPGETVAIRITSTIESGWHVYSMTTPAGGPKPATFALESSPIVEPAGKALQPKPEKKFDENFQVDTEVYESTVEFVVPVRIKADAPTGSATIKGTVSFQVCDPKQCIPGTYAWEAVVTVDGGAARSEYSAVPPGALLAGTDVKVADPKDGSAQGPKTGTPTPDAPVASTQGDAADVQRARNQGLGAFLWLAINVGFLSLLTPCVFPMIPITVSYFTKHEGKSRAKGIADAGIYALSIVFTFTLLGLVTTLLFGATGIRDFAANPWVNVLLAAIFVGLALNLFGFYEIFVPGSVLTPLSRLSEKGGFVGTLLMGVTFTLTSFTCTVPFVGALLVSTAQGDLIWPIVGMLGYSVAFALPFFLLALFPGLLSSLPKAGGWMLSVKVVMGFLELAAALKFVSNVDLVIGTQKITREVFLSAWIALSLMTVFYLLGKIRLPHERAVETIGVVRLLFGTLFLTITFYLFAGLLGARLGELEAFLPPISSSPTGGLFAGSKSESSEPVWHKDYQKALESARANNRLLFIDFTGYACTNCRWMEQNIFPVPAVRTELDRFELVQLFTDGQGPEYDKNRELQETKFGTVALPLYVVIDPKDEREVRRVEGLTRSPDEFAGFLKATHESVAQNSNEATPPIH